VKRRFFLFAAPAIVAAPSLMRVSSAAASALSLFPETRIFSAAIDFGPHSLLTDDIIMKEALLHLENSLVMSKLMNRDYEASAPGKIMLRRPIRALHNP
jgi:hypothetical protein